MGFIFFYFFTAFFGIFLPGMIVQKNGGQRLKELGEESVFLSWIAYYFSHFDKNGDEYFFVFVACMFWPISFGLIVIFMSIIGLLYLFCNIVEWFNSFF